MGENVNPNKPTLNLKGFDKKAVDETLEFMRNKMRGDLGLRDKSKLVIIPPLKRQKSSKDLLDGTTRAEQAEADHIKRIRKAREIGGHKRKSRRKRRRNKRKTRKAKRTVRRRKSRKSKKSRRRRRRRR